VFICGFFATGKGGKARKSEIKENTCVEVEETFRSKKIEFNSISWHCREEQNHLLKTPSNG
jgi:hypothetical protein